MKLWLADKDLSYNIPEECDRYSWNGTCLEIRQPDWYDDVTPVRETDILRSIDGRAVVLTDVDIERYEFSLHLANITEKEKKAIQDFIKAVGEHTEEGFPFPYLRYAGGVDDHDPKDFVMILMQQEITFTETNTVHTSEPVTDRRYTADISVRITRQERLPLLDNNYWVKIYWEEEDREIKLSFEQYPREQIYGWIESLDGFNSSSQLDGFGSVSNVTLNLVAYAQYNTLPVGHPFRYPHKHIETITKAKVEIYYRRGRQDHILFKGRASTPFRWTDANRIISFDCVMNRKSENIGWQPDFGNNKLIAEFMSKENWPHIFGQGLFKFSPICKTPSVQIAVDLYVTEKFSDPLRNIYKSGEAWGEGGLPVDPDVPMPIGPFQYLIPVEGGAIRVNGAVSGGALTIYQMNVPYMTNVPLVPIEQYDPGFQYKRDQEDYQPNTLFIPADFNTPYLGGKHARILASRKEFVLDQTGAFVEQTINGVFWATIIEQNDHVLYIDDPRNVKGQEITLSGWTPTMIIQVMDNRLFEPGSYALLQADEIKNQRSMKHRRKYLDDEQNHLAVHIRKSSELICTNWLGDKIYPISLDDYTNVNAAFLEVQNRLYWVPAYALYGYTKEGGLYPKQFSTAEGWTDPTWDMQDFIPYLPDGCTLLVLYDHYPEILCDAVNDITDDHVMFDFILEKYTEFEATTHTSTPLPTNFISRDYEDARAWLAKVCKERAKRVVVQSNATAFTSDLLPAVKRTFKEAHIEANSIAFDCVPFEDLITQYRFTTHWNDSMMVMYPPNWEELKKVLPENEQGVRILSYWDEDTWRYWIDWSSKVWRKVTFNIFTVDLPVTRISPLERIRVETQIFTGEGFIEDMRVNDNLVTITMITEEEVI